MARLPKILTVLAVSAAALFAQTQTEKETTVNPGIGMRPPSGARDPRVPLLEGQEFLGLYSGGARSTMLQNRLSNLKRTAEIDSSGRTIQFREKLGDVDLRVPRIMTLEEYIQARRQYYLRQKFVETTVSKLSETYTQQGGGGAIRIDIPVEIKSKAFQRIFGGGTVGLDVSGEINIKGGFRNEKRSEVKTALTRGSDNTFKMEQTQRFNVSGHVGEKVTIKVDQDSERMFDFENNIKLEYKGYEDEIIQSIEAGNISLSLPGTRFVTASMNSAGLFGIKTTSQIGNLKLVTVASQEKGEKKKMSLTGGASKDMAKIDITRYKRGVYFFLDDYYRRQYLVRNENGDPLADPRRFISRIEIYKSAARYEQEEAAIRGFAFVPNPEDENKQFITPPDTNLIDGKRLERGYFLRLEKDEYFIHDQMGYIRLNTPLQDGEVLAVAYEDSSGRVRGDINYDINSKKPIFLRLIKTKDPRPSDPTWPLEWKNVYSLGGRNIAKEGFEFRIYYQPPSGDPEETVTDAKGNKITWLQAFGLDRKNESGEPKPDNIIDNHPLLINFALGEIYFPHLRPFDPEDPYLRSLLQSDDPNKNKLAPAIYDTTVQQVKDKQAKFYMEVKSQNKSAEYSLGMNVIEGSEEVTLNGRPLTRGVDYTIDYMFGRLVILNEMALAANANLEISYESQQMFQIDKRTVMGIRAEYGLWDQSFIGGTFMYLNESTMDQKIRVGKGPMRNMIWDINTSLEFKPFFLTKLANLLPFVDTRQQSTVKFEGEIAQIIPNPNTRNNEKTGDNSGVAYIDDFEASKRITPLPIIRRGWAYASPPLSRYPQPVINDLSDRGRLVYYNPYSQYPIKYIWPNKDINANVAQTTNIMIMEFTPSPEAARPEESWQGIMRSLSSGYSNQTEAKYIEIWVQNDPNTTGVMHIELGKISEDIIPNRKFDTEDRLKNGLRNGLLDDDEDIGLDGMSNNDPRAIAAGGDFWDLNGNNIKDPGEPYSDDDWAYDPMRPVNGVIDYSRTNGTEGNERDAGGRIPDTEDLNGNGDVDLRNDYFHYAIHLNHNHPDYQKYVIGASISLETGEDYGWRLYQIPLNEFVEKFGSPDLSLVEYVRIWFDGFGPVPPNRRAHIISIAEINLVGSDWKEQGIATPEQPNNYTKDDQTFVLSVVNTHENPTYTPPPGVEGEVDRITRVMAKEQSLVLRLTGLLPQYNALAQKTFYDPQDYIYYNTLKMFVYGHDPAGQHITKDSSHVEFFLRFGADENNYYEVRERVYEGWTRNNIEVDLIKLSQMKVTQQPEKDPVTNADIYRQVQPDGRVWVIHGKPALRNIKMLEAGVVNLHPNLPFTGEIWMNELRLSNVKKDKGIAMRARLDVGWADLIRFNSEINRKDADFHNVSERFGTGDNQFSGDFGASISLEKFLPSKLGLSLPLSLNYSTSEATPKYLPGEDIQVTKGLPDSTLERIRTFNEKKGMSISLGFTSRSQNFFVKNILAPFKASYSRNDGYGSNSRQKYQIDRSESGSLSWGIVFGQNNFVRPFGWLGDAKILTKLTDMKLYYLPQSINAKISGSRSMNVSETRTGVVSENSSFRINSGVSGNMKIFESLGIDVSRNYTNDMRDVPDSLVWRYLRSGRFGLLTDIDQNASLRYDPKIFSWFTTNFNYSTNFRYSFNRQQTLAAQSATQGTSLTANGTLNLGTLLKTVYKPKPGARRPTAAPTRPQQTPDQPGGDKGKSGDAKQKQNKEKGSFQIMGIVSGFINAVDPISLKYSDRYNYTQYGLAGIPTMEYQLGLTKDPGVPRETIKEGAGANTMRDSRSSNQTYGVNTGLKIGRNITLSLSYDKNASLNESTTITGQRSESFFIVGNQGMPFP
ncbi:MAG: cell surface protein SprA, partial [candidate division KSB1 bacterium]|nr:cell surface protein SprA [candidate division KSB1 bacterium]